MDAEICLPPSHRCRRSLPSPSPLNSSSTVFRRASRGGGKRSSDPRHNEHVPPSPRCTINRRANRFGRVGLSAAGCPSSCLCRGNNRHAQVPKGRPIAEAVTDPLRRARPNPASALMLPQRCQTGLRLPHTSLRPLTYYCRGFGTKPRLKPRPKGGVRLNIGGGGRLALQNAYNSTCMHVV